MKNVIGILLVENNENPKNYTIQILKNIWQLPEICPGPLKALKFGIGEGEYELYNTHILRLQKDKINESYQQ